MLQQAEQLAGSDLLPLSYYGPANSPKNYQLAAKKVYAVALMGAELGIPMWAAVNNINVINGKPTIAPQLMLSKIYGSGALRDLKISVSDTQASVTMWRKGFDSPHTEVFTMEDAKRLGLNTKDNWNKQPKTMMKWRAVAACARIVVPDVILGMYTQEEMGANVIYDEETGAVESIEEGQIVEPVTHNPPKVTAPEPHSETTDEVSGGSDEVVHLFVATNEINKKKLTDFWVKAGFADKNKKVDWKAALEETRAMLGQPIKGFGDITGYETPEDFFTAMEAFIAENANKQAPAKAKTPAKKFEWTDELAKDNAAWMLANFGLNPDYGLLKAKHGKVRDYATQDKYRADVIALAIADGWAVNSQHVTYAGKQSPIVFETAIGNIRWYGRTSLKEALGEESYELFGFDMLTDDYNGKLELNSMVALSWKREGDAGKEYLIATEIQSAEEVPF